jgi:hypothetical protein
MVNLENDKVQVIPQEGEKMLHRYAKTRNAQEEVSKNRCLPRNAELSSRGGEDGQSNLTM